MRIRRQVTGGRYYRVGASVGIQQLDHPFVCDVMAITCNPSTSEARQEDPKFKEIKGVGENTEKGRKKCDFIIWTPIRCSEQSVVHDIAEVFHINIFCVYSMCRCVSMCLGL